MADPKFQHHMAGLKFFGQGQFEQAIFEYRKALDLSPDSPEILNAMAISQSKLGRHDEAIATIQRVIALTPEDPFAFTSLSIFLQRQGKIPEAEAAGAKARMLNWKDELKRNPNAPRPDNDGKMKVIQ